MDGTLIDPEKVMDLVKLVSSSATHTLAQREDRSLWVWGENTSGALATGSTQRQTHPYKADLSPLEGRFIVKLATRNNASFAVTEDGTLWTWGSANAMRRQTDTGTSLQNLARQNRIHRQRRRHRPWRRIHPDPQK